MIVGGAVAAAVIAIVAVVIFLLGVPRATAPAGIGPLRRERIVVDGRERTYGLFIPERLGTGAPLLIVLHGSGQTGESVRRATGFEFDELAARDGAVVAYPDGYRRGWNDGRLASRTPARREEIDDVTFLTTLVDRIAAEHGIHPRRVFAVGYSNGGQLTFRLLADSPALLAGVAVIGANLPEPSNRGYGPFTRPVPFLTVAGTADRTSPFTGGEVKLLGLSPRGRVLSAADTVGVFRQLNGITAAPTFRELPHRARSKGTTVTVHSHRQEGAAGVDQYTVRGGGHVIPGRSRRFPRILGRSTYDLDTATTIWDVLRVSSGL
ncbi:hypothetical protein ET475_06410 [Microbacterium protaetiae]|uniref:Polyhydroxybutyrate depolymerase n=1 Tax=Microbacterium protaetiae TaxID=2509458 RepID=A0A4P6EBS4_9MICO|nr:PHB depolymerase family esterase [Microbacterium protaetiae]QAY59660.1 hypothetical protein ET475_06410 [Microbacterium protaetiae]